MARRRREVGGVGMVLGGACVVGGLGGRWGGLDLLKVALIFAADALQMRCRCAGEWRYSGL